MTIAAIEGWLPECTANHNDGRPAIGLGFIITLFFRDGHTKDVRENMMKAVDKYYSEFRKYLKKHDGTEKFTNITEGDFYLIKKKYISYSEEESWSWKITSAEDLNSAPEYCISVLSGAVWDINRSLSVIKLTFPWHYLKQNDGLKRYQDWLLFLCNLLPVENGYAGLSSSLPYDDYNMFPYEYQLAKRFSGLMVDSIGVLSGNKFLDHIKGVSWYTVLGNKYVERLGGQNKLIEQFADEPQIQLLPYQHGLIIKAGDFPEMGEIRTEGLPPLFVKVNRVIKPIRLQKTGSLHFYSDKVDFQFDKVSTAKWYARFDDPEPESLHSSEHTAADYPRSSSGHIVLPSGDICPFSGVWSALASGKIIFQRFIKGQIIPKLEDKAGITLSHQWTLLNPDETIKNYPIPAAVPKDI